MIKIHVDTVSCFFINLIVSSHLLLPLVLVLNVNFLNGVEKELMMTANIKLHDQHDKNKTYRIQKKKRSNFKGIIYVFAKMLSWMLRMVNGQQVLEHFT